MNFHSSGAGYLKVCLCYYFHFFDHFLLAATSFSLPHCAAWRYRISCCFVSYQFEKRGSLDKYWTQKISLVRVTEATSPFVVVGIPSGQGTVISGPKKVEWCSAVRISRMVSQMRPIKIESRDQSNGMTAPANLDSNPATTPFFNHEMREFRAIHVLVIGAETPANGSF